MSRRVFFAAPALIAISLSLVTLPANHPLRAADEPSSSNTTKAATASEDESIKQLGEAYVQAFNAADPEAISNLWDADSEYTDDDGTATRGKAAISERFTKLFGEQKGLKVALAMKSPRLLTPEVALADGIAEVTNGEGEKNRSKFHAVMVRKEGKWLLHTVRDLPDDVDHAVSPSYQALKPLAWLVGQWTAGTKEAPVALSCRWDRNQSFLIQEYALKEADGDIFTVSQRIGYDPLTGQLKSWTFDSRGGFGEGYWTRDGNSWVVESAGVLVGGGQGSSRNIWRFGDHDHFEWESRDREVDDMPTPDVTVKFTRKPQTTAAVQPK